MWATTNNWFPTVRVPTVWAPIVGAATNSWSSVGYTSWSSCGLLSGFQLFRLQLWGLQPTIVPTVWNPAVGPQETAGVATVGATTNSWSSHNRTPSVGYNKQWGPTVNGWGSNCHGPTEKAPNVLAPTPNELFGLQLWGLQQTVGVGAQTHLKQETKAFADARSV